MNSFATILKLDFNATFRSRWFWVYAVLVIASMGGIFATGIQIAAWPVSQDLLGRF